MIRLFLFVLVRFFIVALAIYFALTLLKKVIQTLQGKSQPSPRRPQQETIPKTTVDYKDVKDARFTELPKTHSEDSSQQKDSTES
jgi:hypothetical protein